MYETAQNKDYSKNISKNNNEAYQSYSQLVTFI